MKFKAIALSSLFLAFCLTANAQSGRKNNQPNEPQNQTEAKRETKGEENTGEIKPLKLLNKPSPDTISVAECFRNEGFTSTRTALRVTFDASAKITNVEIVKSSGCQPFDEESVDAARRIKFEPAAQNGKPITVTKIVVYQGGVGRRI